MFSHRHMLKKFNWHIMCSLGGMERFLCIILWMFLAKAAFGNEIFKDINFSDKEKLSGDVSNTYKSDINISNVYTKDIRHRLLEVLGEHLLSTNACKNILAQIFLIGKGSLEEFKEQLTELLKPFADENASARSEISFFVNKVLNAVQPLKQKANLSWNDIKGIFPALQIFCKQLIDRIGKTPHAQ